MTLKDALVYFGVSGFVSKAALGRGSSVLLSTVFVVAVDALRSSVVVAADPQAG